MARQPQLSTCIHSRVEILFKHPQMSFWQKDSTSKGYFYKEAQAYMSDWVLNTEFLLIVPPALI